MIIIFIEILTTTDLYGIVLMCYTRCYQLLKKRIMYRSKIKKLNFFNIPFVFTIYLLSLRYVKLKNK